MRSRRLNVWCRKSNKVKLKVDTEENPDNALQYFQTFVFELHASAQSMQRATLCLAVMEAGRGPPRLLGEAYVGLSAVWAQPHHTVSHKWAQLSLSRDVAGTTGYLKVDIAIVKIENNSLISYDEKIEVLLPSESEQQRACYEIAVYAAYGLPSSAYCHADRNNKPPSTFVRVTFSGLAAKTGVRARSHCPAYAEQVSMVGMFPNVCQTIRFEVCSADDVVHRVLGRTHLSLERVSHCVENGFLPTFGPSLLHMYGSWYPGAISGGEDGPYHRGAILVALRTIVPYSKEHLRTVWVQQLPPLKLESLWPLEEYCVYSSIFEVSMLDTKLSGMHCGVAITIGDLPVEDKGDAGSLQALKNVKRKAKEKTSAEKSRQKSQEEFCELVDTIKQSKLHYTGSLDVNNSSPMLGYLEFANEFPVLQLAVRLPDFRFRMYRNNMVYNITSVLERELCNVDCRLRGHDYHYPGELVDRLQATLAETAARVLKFLDMTRRSMYEEHRGSTELDLKQMQLQKEEMEKIYQRLSKKTDKVSSTSLTGKRTLRNSKDHCKRSVKQLLFQGRTVLGDLNELIFKVPDGWPDIVLWLLSSGSRIAYAKITPTDIIYSAIPEQRGRFCGQINTVYLKPIKCSKHCNVETSCQCIAAKVELLGWLGPHRHRTRFEACLPPGFSLKTKQAGTHGMFIECMPLVVECRVYIYCAEVYVDDDTASVSPVVRINFMNAAKKTQTAQNTATPLWNEVIKICQNTYSSPQRLNKSPPEVLVEIYDKDTNRKSFLGRTHIAPLVSDPEDCPPALQWLELTKGNEQIGRILVSAQLIQMTETLVKATYYCPAQRSTYGPGITPEDTTSPPERLPHYLIPTPTSYKVDVYWWGLRDVTVAHKPCVALELADVTIRSCIIKTAKASCNFTNGKTSQMFHGDLNDSRCCSPLSVKLYDSATFGRTLLVGMNEVRNPRKYMVRWIPVHKREESLHSSTITMTGFVQVNQMLFVKKIKRHSDHDESSLSPRKSQKLKTAKLSCWRKWFSKKTPEERYTLLPVYKKKSQERVMKSHLEEKDWWMRYTVSKAVYGDEEETTDDRFTVFDGELECQPGFFKFKDWCSTLKIYNGKKTGIPDKDDQLQCGFLKMGLVIYQWPPPENTVVVSPSGVQLNRGYFAEHPDNEPASFLVRVYLVKASDLAPGLAGKEPSVSVHCGRRVLTGRGDLANSFDPVFGKMFEFHCSLPEDYKLRVSLLERDSSPPEDLIGSTTIDLEDRIYTKHRACVGLPNEYHTRGPARWRDIKKPSAILEELCQRNHLPAPVYPDSASVLLSGVEYKDYEQAGAHTSKSEQKESICLELLHKWQTLPICGHSMVPEHVEARSLYNPDKGEEEQGKIHMWIDIFPLNCGLIPPPVDITPRPMEEFELRVVVWDVQGVRLKGDKVCDIYVKAWIGPSDEAQDTDIHYSSLNGNGCFNWRMIFHFQYLHSEGKLVLHEKGPFTEVVEHFPPLLVVQVQDSKAVAPEDFLGVLMLDLTSMPRGASDAQRRTNLFAARCARAWWPLKALGNSGNYHTAGMIDLELTLLPKEKATLMPVGLGREPPSPLPKPKRVKPIKLCWNLKSKYIRASLGISVLIFFVVIIVYLMLSCRFDSDLPVRLFDKMLEVPAED